MTISEFIWGLIWFTVFSVAVVAIVSMAKSIVKGCRLDKMSTFRGVPANVCGLIIQKEREALELYSIPAECDYAKGNCFSCGKPSESKYCRYVMECLPDEYKEVIA